MHSLTVGVRVVRDFEAPNYQITQPFIKYLDLKYSTFPALLMTHCCMLVFHSRLISLKLAQLFVFLTVRTEAAYGARIYFVFLRGGKS